jgi:hypothetical protein
MTRNITKPSATSKISRREAARTGSKTTTTARCERRSEARAESRGIGSLTARAPMAQAAQGYGERGRSGHVRLSRDTHGCNVQHQAVSRLGDTECLATRPEPSPFQTTCCATSGSLRNKSSPWPWPEYGSQGNRSCSSWRGWRFCRPACTRPSPIHHPTMGCWQSVPACP